MKRGLALLVATLCYFCTYSQEASTSNNIPEFVVTPRFDVNPYAPVKGGYSGYDFGNSSLYTFLDGEIGNFSYSFAGHWFSSDWASTKALYENAFRSDDVDFIDWLTLSYQVGQFGFTVGKDMLAIGTWELDYYDVDVHTSLVSPFWHKMAIYQWGGEVNYTSKDESTWLRFQFSTSPFGERPFASKLFTYSLYWSGEYGCFSPIWSTNFVEYERGKFINLIALGNSFSAGDFTIEVDYMNRASSVKRFFNQEWSISGQLLYNYKDKVEVFAKGGYENYNSDLFGYEYESADDIWFIPTDNSLCPKYWYAGGGVHYFPLRDSRDLRLHAVVTYNNFAKSVSFTLGAVYHFNLTQTILKNRK
ncbi:MAG: hypothetical protein IKA07_04915 [Alistipes sp.]|nr:hypothetical protein [Alistipes sp.]